ncbi:holo-ACP synthase [Hoyosella sp. G463]|uniref:Holo-[acyl-carrier-protein] synthase n=1 Tax=Lolliginicoccus lacisalsi TaxID=2742202 RepID=A0A927PM43_9ACTN|nr:holo-ACP synthase [Lolliginicoccus lacisalsi]MBD8506047.1 holo-ACP synthase [Lolliginicoccus lacisalsi]
MSTTAVRGIGFDLVDVPAFAGQLARPGTTMLRNFTPAERRHAAAGGGAAAGGVAAVETISASSGESFHQQAAAGAPGDSSRASSADSQARHLAARWAAKEALVKAWSGSRFGRPRLLATVDYQDIEVVTDHVGRPRIVLHGPIAEHLRDATIHVSLTHDGDTAGAFVIIEG